MKGTEGHVRCFDAVRRASAPVRSLGLFARWESGPGLQDGDGAGRSSSDGEPSPHPSCVVGARFA